MSLKNKGRQREAAEEHKRERVKILPGTPTEARYNKALSCLKGWGCSVWQGPIMI